MKLYSPEIIAALESDKPVATLVELYLAEGNFYFTTANLDITYNEIEYIASGLLMTLDSVKQKKELRVTKLRLEFSAAEQSLLAIFLNNNNTNRRVKVIQAIVDDNMQVIGPLLTSNYLIDTPNFIEGDGKSSFSLTITNFLADFQAVRGVYTTQASFRRFYPQSTAFINSKDAGSPLKWGGK